MGPAVRMGEGQETLVLLQEGSCLRSLQLRGAGCDVSCGSDGDGDVDQHHGVELTMVVTPGG